MEKQLPDEEVLRLALTDPSHFAILVDKYQTPFTRKVLGIVRNPSDAEDIVQETFVKIYKYGHRFKKEENIEFKSWAYKILMNTSFTRYQELKKRLNNEEYFEPVTHNDLSVADGRDIEPISDAKTAVKEVIEKMPEHLSRVLKLYYIEDKSYKEICKKENLSLATLKMRLFRAKRLFHKISTEM